jgi:hypothetical protein
MVVFLNQTLHRSGDFAPKGPPRGGFRSKLRFPWRLRLHVQAHSQLSTCLNPVVNNDDHKYTHTHMYIYIHIVYIYIHILIYIYMYALDISMVNDGQLYLSN